MKIMFIIKKEMQFLFKMNKPIFKSATPEQIAKRPQPEMVFYGEYPRFHGYQGCPRYIRRTYMYSKEYWIILIVVLAIIASISAFFSHKSFLYAFLCVCVGSAFYHLFVLVISFFKKLRRQL